MISIRKTTNELDRMEEQIHAVSDAYGEALRSTAEYVIELDPADAIDFREHLQALQRHIETATIPENWKVVQASFRGELRDFHQKTSGKLENLRAEIAAASEAVQLFAATVSASDSDHEVQIKGALAELTALEQSVNPEELRMGIRQASGTISESIEVMQRSHQVAITELRAEIRVLHQQIERNSHLIDPATGVWNRRKLDAVMAELQQADQPFCVLLVCVRNLKLLDGRHSPKVVEGALRALLQRLSGMLELRTVIGRWDEQNFAAILEMEPASAISVSRSASYRLSGEYPIQENGLSQRVRLQAVAGVIERSAGSDEASFCQKLLQMSQAIAGA